ncbi:hypothetical protein NQ314_002259 [Rhamnusium bicolor]|uniref:Uncharacterized protein n=1 Tax=Rhamnusium bicolor TaxID=1586634 RepID=A0AAV8ZTJ5_9CUCU|nr:hypothetical protein NQ314_002259 [Rhamnusium bicolor]
MEMMNLLCDSYCCRLCAEENKNGTNLFLSDENSDNLSLLVNRYLPLKIEDNGKFPKLICPGCHIQLEATKSFMDLIIEGQIKLRDIYRTQQEILQREEKQRQKLEEALHTVNPNSSVETYTIHSDETGEKFLIQIFSDGPLFTPDHELSLRTEGLEKPRRKRGRPPKQVPEPGSEENEEKFKYGEAEIAQKEEENEVYPDDKNLSGKELDKIFQEEGVIDETEPENTDVQVSNVVDEVIGRTETENGEDLGQPVILVRGKARSISVKFAKGSFYIGVDYELHKKSHKIQYVCQEPGCGLENQDKMLVDEHQSETGHTGVSAVERFESVGGTLQFPESADVVKMNELPATESSKTQFRCEQCDKSFSCKQNMTVHNRVKHMQDKPFSCDKCNQKFSYSNSLKLHTLQHEKGEKLDKFESEYPCETCGKILQHPSSLLYHRETEHSNGRRFVCNKCNKSFKHRQLLQRHQLVHSDERPFHCQQCDASFKTHANLTNHEAVHTGNKKYICSQCGQKFAHRTSLTLHQRWHDGHKPYTCDVCQKAFSQKGNLAEHKRIHTGEKPYCCDHCGKSFTTSSQYNLHRKRHTGERPWVCEYCSKTFLHKDTFKTHVRRHLNDRPYKCKSCPRAFTEGWALKRHERTHSGERPYACEQCGKTFADSSNKSKHMRTHNSMNVKHIYSNSDIKPIFNRQEFEIKDDSLLHVLDPTMNVESQKTDVPDLHLTQLVDQQGNPISITTQDGQTVPVVTGANDEDNIQGLLPDGTLVPIEITAMQEKDLIQEDVEDSTALLNQEIQNEIKIFKEEELIKEGDQKLDTNIQFLTGEDGQENNAENENNGMKTRDIEKKTKRLRKILKTNTPSNKDEEAYPEDNKVTTKDSKSSGENDAIHSKAGSSRKEVRTKRKLENGKRSEKYRKKYERLKVKESKKSLADLTPLSKTEMLTRFKAGHGKGAPDSVGATLKRTADRLVAQSNDINNFKKCVTAVKECIKKIKIEVVTGEDLKNIDNQILEDFLTVEFILRSGENFYWPVVPHKQSVPANKILYTLNEPPIPCSSRYFQIREYKEIDLLRNNLST